MSVFMQRLVLTVMLACLAPLAAQAEVKVVRKTQHYEISGKTGLELLAAMDRKGPRHGALFGRAIAQTQWPPNWQWDWKQKDGVCRIANVRSELKLTFVYPQLSPKAPPALKAAWAPFLAGVVRHEQVHGRVAEKMIARTDAKIRSFPPSKAANCRLLDAGLRLSLYKMVLESKREQDEFDRKEHRRGGPVEKLVKPLLKTGTKRAG